MTTDESAFNFDFRDHCEDCRERPVDKHYCLFHRGFVSGFVAGWDEGQAEMASRF